MNKPLLSICIPTYNRGKVLDKTLETYINDPDFDERVEIVISDNCSTDHTQEIVTKYLNLHSNIRYNRLSKNIGADLNMSTVLLMGNGFYLKLMNDSVSIKPGILKYMLDIINLGKNQMKPTFFYQNISFLNSNKIVHCSNLNELVSNVSFWSTWIANFGIWRKDFESLENKDRYAYLQFPQTDWTLRIIYKFGGYIHFGDYYYSGNLESKGGYNIFQTFGVNYLSLYDEYVVAGIIHREIIKNEKEKLFKNYLLPTSIGYSTSVDIKYTFETSGALKILYKGYYSYLYFYLGILKYYFTLLLKHLGLLSIFKLLKTSIINKLYIYIKL